MNDSEDNERKRHKEKDEPLAEAICSVACAIHEFTEQRRCEFEWSKSHANLATKLDLDQMECRIMSKVTEYIAASDAKFAELATSADELQASQTVIGSSLTGVAADIAFVKAKLEEIQNNPGPISTEDQAALNASLDRMSGLTNRFTTLSAGLKAQADAIKALDEATAQPELPVPPTPVPEPPSEPGPGGQPTPTPGGTPP